MNHGQRSGAVTRHVAQSERTRMWMQRNTPTGQFARTKLELAVWLVDGGPCCEAGHRTFPDNCPTRQEKP